MHGWKTGLNRNLYTIVKPVLKQPHNWAMKLSLMTLFPTMLQVLIFLASQHQ